MNTTQEKAAREKSESKSEHGKSELKSELDGSALRTWRILLPAIVAVAATALWELVVRLYDIQPYVLPGPLAVLRTLISDWDVLSQSLLTTLSTTVEGFAAAAIGGVALALLFNL